MPPLAQQIDRDHIFPDRRGDGDNNPTGAKIVGLTNLLRGPDCVPWLFYPTHWPASFLFFPAYQ